MPNTKYQINRFSILLLLITTACAVNRDFYLTPQESKSIPQSDEIFHTIYFLGGSDQVQPGVSSIGQLLNDQIEESGKKSTLLLLGNNSLRRTTAISDSSRKSMEKRELLKRRYDFFNNLKGKYYGVMGTHEWANGSRKGMENVRILEEIIEDELDQGNIIRPPSGCPGPEEIEIGDSIVLLLIDTQWLFHNWDKPKIEEGCEAANNLDFYVNLDDAIKRNYKKRIIVAGYHSLAGNGQHGGYFPTKAHFIPLPGLGSLNVLYRSGIGGVHDLHNPKYKEFINTMKDILKIHDNIIYVSAHEKTMEYHQMDNMHFLNSGSYSKGVEVAQKNADFASGKIGYGRIIIKKNGSFVLEFWGSSKGEPELLYQKELFQDWPEAAEDITEFNNLDYSDSVATAFASDMYTKKGKRSGFLGNNYRREWLTEIEDIPYFDIGKEMGGLEIIKRGGGNQTKSLRLENDNEKQYVLRSLEKYPESAVPPELRNTVAVDIVTDQVSSSHPYAAYAITKLAEAVGVYHTNPKLFYLPHDPRLGIYELDFGGGLYLFEERPAKDRSDVASFGNSKEIINTPDVLKEIHKDGDHYIDQESTLRARLLDMLIGDWDRHDDQWRWAEFKDKDGFTFYRPVPRDRDQAFFWSDGLLNKMATRKWGLRALRGFDDEIHDVKGLSFYAKHFDRSFINEMNRDDWIKAATFMKDQLTDEVIKDAIHDLPEEIFEISGNEIINKLKNRRDHLVQYADEYYSFLCKQVDVLGSNKNEHFIVERIDSEQTRVTVNLLKSKPEDIKRKMYERMFYTSETNEICLYGLGGDDRFDITGNVSGGIKIRIIGGKGEDQIDDQSKVIGSSKKTLVYDTKSKTTIITHREIKDLTSDKDPLINDYNRKQFQYNLTMPLLYLGYNPDDGLFIGGGVMTQIMGFRKDPFKSKHIIKANIAPKSGSYDFLYSGTFTEAMRKCDLIINAKIFAPSYTDYFYGYGNETVFEKEKLKVDRRHYGARYVQYIFYPEIARKSKDELHRFLIGGGYQMVYVKSDLNDLNNEQARFIVNYANTLDYDLLDVRRHYLALYGSYTYDNTNSEFYPQEGIKWNLFLIGLNSIDGKEISVNYQRIRTDLSYYYSFGRFLRTTLALRVGGIFTSGNFEFYHAAKIGGSDTFRGVRKFRFSGENSFYQNTDLRLRLFHIRNPILPTSFGLVFFHDFGRVWMDFDPSTENGESKKMHRAYGGGIWLSPLNKISIGLDYSRSTLQEDAIYLRMGFFF